MQSDASTSMIDFRRSIPPHVPELPAHISTAMRAIAARDTGLLMRQSVAKGSEFDRAAGALFLRARVGENIDPSRIMLTNGTQNALLVLLQMLAGPGGQVLAERLSYGSLRALGQIANVRLHGLEIDDHGIVPEAFEAACKARSPRVLYCNPTVQNPTAALMPETRRLAIIDIARRHGVAIIEDDALGRVHVKAPRPLATLAPDITWYIMSTTKCLAQGLRVAYVIAPKHEGASQVISSVEHLSYWHAAPLNAALVSQWIAAGVADQITARIAQQCGDREQLARQVLADFDIRSATGSMHVWVHLPAHYHRHDFVANAQRRGVLVRPADLFAVDEQPAPNAVRLALSPPASIDEVMRGLLIVKELLGAACVVPTQYGIAHGN